jgi:hypothetical protein
LFGDFKHRKTASGEIKHFGLFFLLKNGQKYPKSKYGLRGRSIPGQVARSSAMKPLPRKYQMLLVAIISLGILILPGYILFNNLSELDLLRSALNWENPDDIDQCASFEKKWKMVQVSVDSIRLVPEDRIFESVELFSSQHHLPIEKAAVLRC